MSRDRRIWKQYTRDSGKRDQFGGIRLGRIVIRPGVLRPNTRRRKHYRLSYRRPSKCRNYSHRNGGRVELPGLLYNSKRGHAKRNEYDNPFVVHERNAVLSGGRHGGGPPDGLRSGDSGLGLPHYFGRCISICQGLQWDFLGDGLLGF